jgi:heterotetrameric sarcosine oxidase gamma subunit
VYAPEPRSALADHLAASPRAATGASLGERRAGVIEIAARRGREAELAEAIAAGLGAAGPALGRAVAASRVTLMRLAPATLLATGAEVALLALARAVARDVAAVIDQSGGFAILRVAGPRAAAMLSKACRLDLHPAAFGAGRAGRTLMAQTPVVIHQVDDAPTFDMIVPRTLARSLVDALLQAGEEYGLSILPPETA